MIRTRRTSSTLYPLLGVLLVLIFVLLGTLTTSGTGLQERERSVEIWTHQIEPLEIVSVKVKGVPIEPRRKFISTDDWLNEMVVTVKNSSDRAIAYAAVLVLAPNEKNGVRKKVDGRDTHSVIGLAYGKPPSPLDAEFGSTDAGPLMPGQTADLQIDHRRHAELHRRLANEDSSTSISEIVLTVDRVAFDKEERCWLHGAWCRRDANGRWLILNEPRAEITRIAT